MRLPLICRIVLAVHYIFRFHPIFELLFTVIALHVFLRLLPLRVIQPHVPRIFLLLVDLPLYFEHETELALLSIPFREFFNPAHDPQEPLQLQAREGFNVFGDEFLQVDKEVWAGDCLGVSITESEDKPYTLGKAQLALKVFSVVATVHDVGYQVVHGVCVDELHLVKRFHQGVHIR